MTTEDIKLFFSGPFGMFMLMLLASIGNGIKQLKVVQQTGTPMTLIGYLAHWPETLAMLLGNIIALIILVLTDQLNYVSALGVGYGVNSVADLLPGTRSMNLKQTPDDPEKIEAKEIKRVDQAARDNGA